MSQIDLWYASRATGIVALVLLTATVLLGILVAGRSPSAVPGFARVEIHRRISTLAVVFVAVHVITAVMDSYVHIGWLALIVPFASRYDRFWVAVGTVGVDLLLAVALSSALKARIPARAWRAFHWLAYLSWPVALSHALGMGPDTKLDWVLVLAAACTASVVGASAWRVWSTMRARASQPATLLLPRRSLRSGPVGHR